MNREIVFRPAYDKTDEGYGVHGVELAFYLKGDLGAVQFVLYTNWHLPHVQEKMDKRMDRQFPHLSCHPQPADLGFHSPKPTYEGQETIRDECPFLDDKPCYYDGSTLNAESIYQTLLTKGHEGVWQELEDYYKSIFGELK